MGPLAGRTIVLGVTGGIAAYKAAELVRLLVKRGARVHVTMSRGAEAFITPLTLQTLSGNRVATHLLDPGEDAEIGHIKLADAADLVVIAPATANAIARMAAGMADEMLTAVVLASRAPVLLAPAMNVNMWENPLVQQNLARLIGTGRFETVGPDAGPLACGWVGQGRLVDPEVIADAAARLLEGRAGGVSGGLAELAGRRVVVSAGPTREPIDAVRFIANRSSGKMGFSMAEVAASARAHVVLIAGPTGLPTPAGVAKRVDVESALEMQAALEAEMVGADVLVMAAAVADLRPQTVHPGKLSRSTDLRPLDLVANPDILAGLARARREKRPLLVGFAAETATGDELRERGRKKLTEKGCDVVVANCISAPGVGFDADENEVSVLFGNGRSVDLPRAAKKDVAVGVWRALLDSRLLLR